MKAVILLCFLLIGGQVYSQTNYNDSIRAYLDGYVRDHEVVQGDEKQYFRFFPPDQSFRVVGTVEPARQPNWFLIESSGHERKMYRVYGTVSFQVHDTLEKLNLYQSQSLLADPQYKDYLVLMFTDKTSGNECYDVGRYLDFTTADIRNGKIVIDFNKAYNPYCAYISGKYNCPIPPKENNLSVAITAGEMNFGKKSD
jgi:uncharacterized protein